MSELELKLTEELREMRSLCEEVYKILTLCLIRTSNHGSILTDSDEELVLKYLEAAIAQR